MNKNKVYEKLIDEELVSKLKQKKENLNNLIALKLTDGKHTSPNKHVDSVAKRSKTVL